MYVNISLLEVLTFRCNSHSTLRNMLPKSVWNKCVVFCVYLTTEFTAMTTILVTHYLRLGLFMRKQI